METIKLFGREFVFLNPEYLGYLTKICLPLAGVWLLVFILKRLQRPSRTLGSKYPLIGTMKFWAKMIAVLAITAIALARPVSKEDLVVEKSSADLIFVLDNSLSMRALDVNPRVSRLEIAKEEIRKLITNQVIKEGDRVSLFNFAKISSPVMPLSVDLQLFSSLLEEIDYTKPLDESYWNTDLNNILFNVIEQISRQREFDSVVEGLKQRSDGARKIVILFTDGEDQFFSDPETRGESQAFLEEALTQFRKSGIKIYCVGIGTRSGFPWLNLLYGYRPGDDYDENYTLDWAGKKTSLNAQLLERLASATGGAFFTIENSRTSAFAFLSRVIDANRKLVGVSERENNKEWWPVLVRAALFVVILAIFFY
jgi:hypothetical protein